jgi:hypothetical protein
MISGVALWLCGCSGLDRITGARGWICPDGRAVAVIVVEEAATPTVAIRPRASRRRAASYGLPEKTSANEDHTSSQLDPSQVTGSAAVQTPHNTTELRKEGMAPFHRTANPTNARRSCLSAAGRTHAKAAVCRPLAGRFIAIRAVATSCEGKSRTSGVGG